MSKPMLHQKPVQFRASLWKPNGSKLNDMKYSRVYKSEPLVKAGSPLISVRLDSNPNIQANTLSGLVLFFPKRQYNQNAADKI